MKERNNILPPLKLMDLKEIASLTIKSFEQFLYRINEDNFMPEVSQLLDLKNSEVLEDEIFRIFYYEDDDMYGDFDLMDIYEKMGNISLLEYILHRAGIKFEYRIQQIGSNGMWILNYESDEELELLEKFPSYNYLEYEIDTTNKEIYIFGMSEEQSIDAFTLIIECDDEEHMMHTMSKRIANTNKYVVTDIVDNSNGITYDWNLNNYNIPCTVVSFMKEKDMVKVMSSPVKVSLMYDVEEELSKELVLTKEVVF